MNIIPNLPPALVLLLLAASSGRAFAEDNSPGRPFVQASFDRLIPSAFPTIQVNYERLRQATFDRLIPSSYPTVQPDFARLQQTAFASMIPTSFPAIPPSRGSWATR
jgi:hypothetical protein